MNAIPQNNDNANEQEKVPYKFEHAVLKYPEETKGLVSIIIPIYNTGLYLKETLDSVIAQTFENWEAILVDDGSTDESPKICVEYAEKDSRFKYINKNNEGPLLARKTGLENSMGEFITNLDSDDVYKPQFLEKMVDKIRERNSDFVYCKFAGLNTKIKSNETENYKLSENKLQNCYNLSKKFTNSLCNKLIKRNIYAKVLFPQIHIGFCGEDMSQTFQIIYHSCKAEFIPERLYLYRIDSIFSIGNSNNIALKKKRYARRVIGMVVLYQLAEKFFGTYEAEKFIVCFNEFEFLSFACYFLLNKEEIAYYKIEYAGNYIPNFLSGMKKSRNKNLCYLLLILASKGILLPYRIYYEIRNKLKIRTRAKVVFKNIRELFENVELPSEEKCLKN